jgi:hypothetical protein
MQHAAILQQQHKQQKQKFPEAFRSWQGSPVPPPKITILQNFPTLEGTQKLNARK